MNAPATLDALSPQLAATVREIMVESRVPGAAVALVVDGRRYVQCHGRVTSEPEAADVMADTAFDLGSCAKGFSAAAVARLVDQGCLGFDDRVQPWLAEFQLDEARYSDEVTIRDLLCNRIGLRRQIPVESFANPELDALEVIQRVRWLDRVCPFREGYVYFNPGFIAARLIVERVSGARYDQFLDDEIFRPLQMTASASGSGRVRRIERRARGHVLEGGRAVPLPERFFDNWQGAAGVYASALDVARWIEYHLGDAARAGALAETHRAHTRMPREQCKLIHAPPDESTIDYCMGWWQTTLRGHQLLQHAGEMFGWRTQIALLPQDGIGVAVLLSAAVSRHQVIAYTVLETLLCGSSRDWTDLALTEAAMQASQVRSLYASEFAPERESTLSLSAYAGHYRHPACGRINVLAREGHLEIELTDGRIWDMVAWPVGGHVFRSAFKKPAVRDYAPTDLPLRFHVVEGRVVGLSDTNARYQRVPEE